MKSVGNFKQLVHSFITSAASRVAAPSADGPEFSIYIYRCLQTSVAPGGKLTTVETIGLLLTGLAARDAAGSFFGYHADAAINTIIQQHLLTEPDHTLTQDESRSLYQLWRVDDADKRMSIMGALDRVVAFHQLDDGNAAVSDDRRVRLLLLADDQLTPLPCHRLLADLGKMDDYDFLQRLQKCFNISVASSLADAMPNTSREFGLCVGGGWYRLRLIEGTWFDADVVSDLDVSVVHDNMIAPLLGIVDANDARIAFTTSACNAASLQQAVDEGQWQAIWLMPPPDLSQLMQISAAGRTLPAYAVCFPQVFDTTAFAVVDR